MHVKRMDCVGFHGFFSCVTTFFSTYFAYHFNCTTNLSLNQHSTTVVAAGLFYFSLVICSICWISTSVGHFAVSVYAILHVLSVHNLYCSWKMPLANSPFLIRNAAAASTEHVLCTFFLRSYSTTFFVLRTLRNDAI